jgi:hypothetical protein
MDILLWCSYPKSPSSCCTGPITLCSKQFSSKAIIEGFHFYNLIILQVCSEIPVDRTPVGAYLLSLIPDMRGSQPWNPRHVDSRVFNNATPQGPSSESAASKHCMYCLSCIQKALQWLFPMQQLYSQRTWPLLHSIQVITKCRAAEPHSFWTGSWATSDAEGNWSRSAKSLVTVPWRWYVQSRIWHTGGGIALTWSYASDVSAHAPQPARGTRYGILRPSYTLFGWLCLQCTSGKLPLCHFYNCFGIQWPNISGPHSSLIMVGMRIC